MVKLTRGRGWDGREVVLFQSVYRRHSYTCSFSSLRTSAQYIFTSKAMEYFSDSAVHPHFQVTDAFRDIHVTFGLRLETGFMESVPFPEHIHTKTSRLIIVLPSPTIINVIVGER